MTFEDLSQWDLNLIRSNGVNMLAFTRVSDRHVAITECTLNCIYSKGYDIVDYPKNLSQEIANIIRPHGFGSSSSERSFEDLVKAVFTYLSQHYVMVKNRESTWSTPNESWYHKTDNVKKPWVF